MTQVGGEEIVDSYINTHTHREGCLHCVSKFISPGLGLLLQDTEERKNKMKTTTRGLEDKEIQRREDPFYCSPLKAMKFNMKLLLFKFIGDSASDPLHSL